MDKGILSDFELDQIYNLALKNILGLIENGGDKQYEIWLREGVVSSDQYGLYNVPTGESIHEKDVVPIELLVHWTPNLHDAGRILRRIVEKVIEYENETNVESKETQDSTPPNDSAETDSGQQTPGVG